MYSQAIALLLFFQAVYGLTDCGEISITDCPADGWLLFSGEFTYPEQTANDTSDFASSKIVVQIAGTIKHWAIWYKEAADCDSYEKFKDEDIQQYNIPFGKY